MRRMFGRCAAAESDGTTSSANTRVISGKGRYRFIRSDPFLRGRTPNRRKATFPSRPRFVALSFCANCPHKVASRFRSGASTRNRNRPNRGLPSKSLGCLFPGERTRLACYLRRLAANLLVQHGTVSRSCRRQFVGGAPTGTRERVLPMFSRISRGARLKRRTAGVPESPILGFLAPLREGVFL